MEMTRLKRGIWDRWQVLVRVDPEVLKEEFGLDLDALAKHSAIAVIEALISEAAGTPDTAYSDEHMSMREHWARTANWLRSHLDAQP